MSAKPRILHLTHTMNQGGIERQLAEIIPRLQADFEMEIGILYAWGKEGFFFQAHLHAHQIPYTLLDKRQGKLARLPFMWRYGRLLARFRPQIIHAHDWHAMDIARAYYRYLGGAKVIGHVHNDRVTERIPTEQKWSGSALVMAQAAFDLEKLYQQHLPTARTITLPNGVDTDFFQPQDRTSARANLNLAPHLHIGLFAGRYAPQKNLEVLLQALQMMAWRDDWKIICIGRADPPDYLDQLRRLQVGLEDRIEFLPPQRDILRYYQASDFLILPSHFEGLPVVVLEASACARPTLISDAANADDLIQAPERGWIFENNHAADLKKQLHAAFSLSPAERDQKGENARQYTLQNYSFSAIIPQYRELYLRLLKEG